MPVPLLVPPAIDTASRPLWHVAVACLLVGLALSVASVPVAAFASQQWGAFSGGLIVPMNGSVVRLEDGELYIVSEQGSTRRGDDARPRLMRLRASQHLPPEGQLARQIDHSKYPPRSDPRPAFLRASPPHGYTGVQGYSSGWPWHAGHSKTYRGAASRRTHGEAAFGLAGRNYVLPFLPIWTGLLGNTLLYGGVLLLAWWLLRGRRLAGRRARGECLACGYTLDAGMDRCPECGAAAAPRA